MYLYHFITQSGLICNKLNEEEHLSEIIKSGFLHSYNKRNDGRKSFHLPANSGITCVEDDRNFVFLTTKRDFLQDGWKWIWLHKPDTKAVNKTPPKYGFQFDCRDLRNTDIALFRHDDPANHYKPPYPPSVRFTNQELTERSEVMIFQSLDLNKYCKALLINNESMPYDKAKKMYG